jgi:hypothetical protein
MYVKGILAQDLGLFGEAYSRDLPKHAGQSRSPPATRCQGHHPAFSTGWEAFGQKHRASIERKRKPPKNFLGPSMHHFEKNPKGFAQGR